jgi:hypothetical protein
MKIPPTHGSTYPQGRVIPCEGVWMRVNKPSFALDSQLAEQVSREDMIVAST